MWGRGCVVEASPAVALAACGRARRSAETGNVKCLAIYISALYMVQFECFIDPLCTSLVSCRLHSLCTCALVLGWGEEGPDRYQAPFERFECSNRMPRRASCFPFTFTFFFFPPIMISFNFHERDPRNSASA